MTKLIDIGVNLTDKRFAQDQAAVVAHTRDAGVNQMIITCTALEMAEQVISLAEEHRVYATMGIHPHDASSFSDSTYMALKALALHPRVVAIGETGLDFNRNFSSPEDQVFAFSEQLKLASELQLPLFLHERDAAATQLELLVNADLSNGGVLHCFTGDQAALEAYLALGLHIGITGWVCDERRGEALQKLVPLIPSDRLLIETDAPYLLPRNYQPKPKKGRNEPSLLPHILDTVALLRGDDPTVLAQQVYRNSHALFKIG